LVLANAGIDQPRSPRKLDWSSVEQVMQVNAMGALATLVPLVRPMVERGRGTLAAVTSVAGLRGMPGHAAYCASKAAVSTYLEALRVDVQPHGVRVVDIRPGFVDTPMTQKNRFPQPFMVKVEDAAKICVRGLERGTPVVTFPWQIAGAMAIAETMPDRLWRSVARWLPR
jgi:short-subunit dehydrogenase